MDVVRACLLVALCLASFAGRAQDTLVIGIDEDYLPWERVSDGQASGINVEILNAVAAKLGLKVTYQPYPFRRILENLKAGTVDMAGGIEFSAERNEFVHFLAPAYQPTVKVFAIPKVSSRSIARHEDLYPLLVGVRAGNKQFKRFDDDTRIRRQEVPTDAQLFKMLLAGRLDTVAGSQTQLLYSAKLTGVADQIKLAPYRVDLGLSGQFVLSRTSPMVSRQREIEATLVAMQRNGDIKKIIEASLR